MTTKNNTMSAAEYRQSIAALGLSQIRAGAMFGLSPRHSQRIAAGDYPVSPSIRIALELMLALPAKRRAEVLARYSPAVEI